MFRASIRGNLGIGAAQRVRDESKFETSSALTLEFREGCATIMQHLCGFEGIRKVVFVRG